MTPGLKRWTSPSPGKLIFPIFGYFRLLLFPLLFATYPAGAALAAESPLVEPCEQEFLTALPIVLTPSRLPQPLNEAPSAVTVIDRELIRQTGYRDIPRLLRLVPGMQIGQERGGRIG